MYIHIHILGGGVTRGHTVRGARMSPVVRRWSHWLMLEPIPLLRLQRPLLLLQKPLLLLHKPLLHLQRPLPRLQRRGGMQRSTTPRGAARTPPAVWRRISSQPSSAHPTTVWGFGCMV